MDVRTSLLFQVIVLTTCTDRMTDGQRVFSPFCSASGHKNSQWCVPATIFLSSEFRLSKSFWKTQETHPKVAHWCQEIQWVYCFCYKLFLCQIYRLVKKRISDKHCCLFGSPWKQHRLLKAMGHMLGKMRKGWHILKVVLVSFFSLKEKQRCCRLLQLFCLSKKSLTWSRHFVKLMFK